MKTVTLSIPEMTCDHCAESVLRGISSVPGVDHADVSVVNKIAVVQFDEEKGGSLDELIQAIDAEGYKASRV